MTPVAAAARLDAVTLALLGVVCEAIVTVPAGLAATESESVFTVNPVFV